MVDFQIAGGLPVTFADMQMENVSRDRFLGFCQGKM
jgi:hypothetical protein